MAMPQAAGWQGPPKFSHEWCEGDPPGFSKLDAFFRGKAEKNGFDMRDVYRYEANRLHSFSTWPDNPVVFPTSLARTGLYYTGSSDTVTCFVCSVKIGRWEKGDLPITEHQKHSPHCPFLFGGDVGNVPLETNNGKFDLEALKDNERNILKTRGCQPHDVSPSLISTSEIETKIDQLLNRYNKCSSLDFTRAQGLRSGFLKPAEELTKKNGFHRNGLQPPLSENNHGAMSLAYGMSNMALEKNNCASSGHKSLEGFDSEAVSPPIVDPVKRDSIMEPVKRDPTPPDADGIQRDAVCVPVETQPVSGQLPPPRRTECDATTFGRSSGAPNINNIQSRIINIPVYQGLTEYCSKEDLLDMLKNAHSLQHAHINERYNSFESWPLMGVQDPRSLAEAGFYYTGQEDRVRCFLCNGGLCNWESTDTPWHEHNKWFGRCQYVVRAKRHEVVKVIIETAAQLSGVPIDDSEPEWYQRSSRHNHDDMPEGMQCDCRLGSVPRHFWRSTIVKQVYEMGFNRNQVESVIDRDGVCVTDSLENVVEALMANTPLYMRQQNQTQTDLTIQNTTPERALNVVQRDDARPQMEVEDKQVTPPRTEPEKATVDPEANSTGLSDIQKENEELKTNRICKICLDTMVQVIFLPCSHLVSCLECSLQLDKCPVCREAIKATARVYL